MSDVIKIIKENKLNIPIGTILHYNSFFDRIHRVDKRTLWDPVRYYIWQSLNGALNVIYEDQIYPDLKGYYVNCICLNWTPEFIYEGDEYWKVYTDERYVKYHKLEFDGKNHSNALLFKPYKDKVHDNTKFMTYNCQRFKSQHDAELYCEKIKLNIKIY